MHITPILALIIGATTTALASAIDPPPPDVRQITDTLLFSTSLPDFLTARQNLAYASAGLDWASDGCSGPTSGPKFMGSCQRHDFGYRNFRHQGRCSDADRERVDENFSKDMKDECAALHPGNLFDRKRCEGQAGAYYVAVRGFGWTAFCGGPF